MEGQIPNVILLGPFVTTLIIIAATNMGIVLAGWFAWHIVRWIWGQIPFLAKVKIIALLFG